MKHLKYLNKYLIKYKWKFLFGFLFVTLSNVFSVIQPRLIRDALDLVIENIRFYNQVSGFESSQLIFGQTVKILLLFAVLVIGCALIMGIFMYLMRETVIVMSRLIEYDLRKEIFRHYEELDQTFYRKNRTGDMMARITEDVMKVRMYLGPAIMYGMNLITLFILIVSAMLMVNVKLTLYALLPLPILSISIYYISNLIHKRSELIQIQLSKLNSIAQEIYSGIRVVKSYVQEKFLVKYFEEESEIYKNKSLALVGVNALFFPMIILLIGLSSVLTIYIGGLQVNSGAISAGNIAEFVIYINQLTWPVTAIGWIASIIQQADASQKRINEFLKIEPLIKDTEGIATDSLGEIVFDHVTFVYPDSGIVALDDVSFKIKPGEKVAFMGRTASGKTTICDLIMRLFDVTKGTIYLDGRDILTINVHDLRERIGFVPQDGFLFSNSIAENIAFGEDHLDHSKIKEYARKAAVYEDIVNLPKQFETLVGERGVTLSGGQKQRVSIARALINDPEIVILDDSMSAVDPKTEKRITDFLVEDLQAKTSIIITHRVNPHMNYDRIFILEKGKIIESGTHEELMDLGGFYQKIVQKQQLDEQQIKFV